MLTIPPQYQQIITLVLVFVDGLIFGVAIKKGVISFVLFLIGLFIASYIGLSLPYVNAQLLISRAISFITYVMHRSSYTLTGLPILFLIGLALGLWKG
ncbi:MAG: hypothetical protein ACP5LW_06315 [Nitrososphaeria archaeon]